VAMSFIKRQRGLSFLGLIVLVGILGFAAVIGLKLVPIYMDSWKIDGVMESVIKEPDITRQSRQEVIELMLKRLDINAVDAVNYSNWKESLTVSKRKNNTSINVNYRIETPLIGNLSLVAEFDKTVSS
jgi:Tfp pilus assembly major pilin PilA